VNINIWFIMFSDIVITQSKIDEEYIRKTYLALKYIRCSLELT
jgi:hypothetical protein